MKRLELSRLMDEYQDNEFFPEGGSAADVETVKNLVLSKAVPAKGRRRRPSLKAALLAAALAVGCVLCIAAGLPATVYHLATGTLSFERAPGEKTITHSYDAPPLTLEDGRLWLDTGSQRIDITDLVNEDTPYIYDGSDPAAGLTYYLVAGGTPEHYGFLEWTVVPNTIDAEGDMVTVGSEDGTVAVYSFDYVMTNTDQGEPQTYHIGGLGDYAFNGSFLKHIPTDDQWLLTALDELDIPILYPDLGSPSTIET